MNVCVGYRTDYYQTYQAIRSTYPFEGAPGAALDLANLSASPGMVLSVLRSPLEGYPILLIFDPSGIKHNFQNLNYLLKIWWKAVGGQTQSICGQMSGECGRIY